MQITITGTKASGKTTVAIEVAKFLRERGCVVRTIGYDSRDSQFLARESKKPPAPESMTMPFPVTIVDSQDDADEIRLRIIKDRAKTQQILMMIAEERDQADDPDASVMLQKLTQIIAGGRDPDKSIDALVSGATNDVLVSLLYRIRNRISKHSP